MSLVNLAASPALVEAGIRLMASFGRPADSGAFRADG